MSIPFKVSLVGTPPVIGNAHYEEDRIEMAPRASKDVTLVVPGCVAGNDYVDAPPAYPQPGVQKVEAITAVLNRNHLIAVYIMMWLVTFVDSTQQGASNALTPYVTSSFSKHSLTAYTGVMSGIIGGILKLPLSKILDIFGRPHGFAISVFFLVVGLILMAVCTSVHAYAAAQIFYWLGYDSMYYTIGVFIADTSSLKNRGFMLAFVNSPYIITAWISAPLSSRFLHGPGWRWCFGAFAIITLFVSIPLFALFVFNYRKAVKAGITTPVNNDLTWSQSVRHYTVEFDAGGLFLISAGLVFVLLPFSLYSYQVQGWKSPMIISFLVIGVSLLVAFALYEKYLAQKTFIPYRLLVDRTVLGANILAAILFISFSLWNTYFSSFLQVVNGLTLTEATFITNIYTVGSCLFSMAVGYAIRISGKFKWIALYIGVPLMTLGVGLMVHFRQPNQSYGFVIMNQIIIAFAGGACVITEQIAAMAATEHQYIAVVLALEGMFSSVGGGIGSSISAAIWTSIFPARLSEYLPEDAKQNAGAIYGSLATQLSYPRGTPTRVAIEKAYGDSQKVMCMASAAFLALALGAVIMWRDIRVKDFDKRGIAA